MGLLSRIFRPSAAKSHEGEFRPGPYLLQGGWLPAGAPWNFWQTGDNVRPYASHSAMVEACVGAYSQTVAMCPGDHWRLTYDGSGTPTGGRERVTGSALSRIVRKPNGYQSMSDFMLNVTRSLYTDGNAYALALRNDRFEPAELHLMNPRMCHHRLGEDGSVFYGLGGNELVDHLLDDPVPARDVLHIRLQTPRHPLKGETPLMAAALDVAASDAMMRQQLAFFLNQARPSQGLSTDAVLTKEQTQQLREKWDEQTKGLNAGGTPILTAGLKPVQFGSTAQDAQLVDMLKLTEQNVALVFRVPLQILGIGGTPYASTELLMQSWIASGLGFALNHIEEAFGQFFGLRGMPYEYLEFDTEALLRSALKDRIEALARGVQGGIYSPDEARARESLPLVQGGYGKEPRVQQQVVPLSWHEEQARLAIEVATAPPALPSPEEEPEAEPEEERHSTDAIIERLYGHADRIH